MNCTFHTNCINEEKGKKSVKKTLQMWCTDVIDAGNKAQEKFKEGLTRGVRVDVQWGAGP